jgi:asparagine synthase (glutamine-hydrolysing)
MCGIAGIHRFRSGRPVDDAELSTMAALLRHRGPDDGGTYRDGCLGLANRRLKVVDLSPRGHQPMLGEDGRLAITYNGEVYNHVELRRELEGRGHRFRSGTDTEVILRLYAELGEGMLERLNGMFALALWDAAERRLLLARDRLGVKPLYLLETEEGLAFASEVRALLPVLGRRPTVRVDALESYLQVGYVPGGETLFREVTKLEPGGLLAVERDGSTMRRTWWDAPRAPASALDPRAAVEELRELVRDAVRLQLRSDVPLGVFLSGGVDSSAVVALMHDLGVGEIRTFTAAYDFGPGYDETPHARRVARRFGTRHQEVFLDAEQFRDAIAPMVVQMEEPVAEAPAISLSAVARTARESVVVALSGEGADEAFGGYPVHGHMTAIEAWRRLPGPLRTALAPGLAALGPKWRKYLALAALPLEERYLGVSFADPRTLARLEVSRLAGEASLARRLAPLYERVAGLDPLGRMAYVDLKTWLPDDLLVKADKMTMAHSLELRVPFLDHRLVELGLSLPSELRLRGWSTKRLLRRALAPYLPKEIVGRRKMGFPVPLAAMFRGKLGLHAEQLLTGERAGGRGYFPPGAARDLLAEHRAGAADHHVALWRLLVLEEWHRAFIDPAPPTVAPGAAPAPPACAGARSPA